MREEERERRRERERERGREGGRRRERGEYENKRVGGRVEKENGRGKEEER